MDDLDENKDEHFEVELYEIDGAQLGRNYRIEVTITDDDGKVGHKYLIFKKYL